MLCIATPRSDMETLDTEALREAARGVVGQYGVLELLMIRCFFMTHDGSMGRWYIHLHLHS